MAQEYQYDLRIKGPESSWEFSIPAGRTIIGRQAGCDLILENQQISRRHASLDCTPESLTLTDLNSSNGTLLKGQPLTPDVSATLTDGDHFQIGPFSLVVVRTPLETSPDDQPPITRQTHAISPAEKTPQVPPEQPPPPKEPPPASIPLDDDDSDWIVPTGLSTHSQTLINYLPDIYHSDFMSHYLGIFESILTPIEWVVDHFDLYLSPGTAPLEFLPWLAGWFQEPLDTTWNESQQRQLTSEAHMLYARRGTPWALTRILEIYTGVAPEIIDTQENLDPFTFIVNLPLAEGDIDPNLVQAIIDRYKPAHTTYELHFVTGR
jgi:phage tail-like protein